MNNELANIKHPSKIRVFWVALYTLITILVIAGFSFAASEIKTHTLPTGQVELSIPYSKYIVGESISFSIKNNYNSSIFVINKCPAEPLAVYRQENGKWVRIHDQASEDACPDEQRQVSVAAGKTANGNFDAWNGLFTIPGKYRIVAFVEYYNSLPYQDIEIIKPIDNKPTNQPSINVSPVVNTIKPETTILPRVTVVSNDEESDNEESDD